MRIALLCILLIVTPALAQQVQVRAGNVMAVNVSANEFVDVRPGDTLYRGNKLIEVRGISRNGYEIVIDGETIRGSVNTTFDEEEWEVEDDNDLAAYAAAVAVEDPAIAEIALGEELAVAYERDARLFGIIPATYMLRTRVTGKQIYVEAPWWLLLATDDYPNVRDAIGTTFIAESAPSEAPFDVLRARFQNQHRALQQVLAGLQ